MACMQSTILEFCSFSTHPAFGVACSMHTLLLISVVSSCWRRADDETRVDYTERPSVSGRPVFPMHDPISPRTSQLSPRVTWSGFLVLMSHLNQLCFALSHSTYHVIVMVSMLVASPNTSYVCARSASSSKLHRGSGLNRGCQSVLITLWIYGKGFESLRPWARHHFRNAAGTWKIGTSDDISGT